MRRQPPAAVGDEYRKEPHHQRDQARSNAQEPGEDQVERCMRKSTLHQIFSSSVAERHRSSHHRQSVGAVRWSAIPYPSARGDDDAVSVDSGSKTSFKHAVVTDRLPHCRVLR
jgi:hypothetical protein